MATKKKAPKATAAKKATPVNTVIKKAAAPKATAKKVVAKAVTPKKSLVSKAVPKKKAATKILTPDKSSALQKIAALQAQVNGLKNEAAQELKGRLSAARGVVRDLENELVSLTGGSRGRKGRG